MPRRCSPALERAVCWILFLKWWIFSALYLRLGIKALVEHPLDHPGFRILRDELIAGCFVFSTLFLLLGLLATRKLLRFGFLGSPR